MQYQISKLTTDWIPIFKVQSWRVTYFIKMKLLSFFKTPMCFSCMMIGLMLPYWFTDDAAYDVPYIPPLLYFLSSTSSTTNMVMGNGPCKISHSIIMQLLKFQLIIQYKTCLWNTSMKTSANKLKSQHVLIYQS